MYMWVYFQGASLNGYTLDNASTDLSSHVPWVYQETLIDTWNHLSKPFDHLVEAVHQEQQSGRLLTGTCGKSGNTAKGR